MNDSLTSVEHRRLAPDLLIFAINLPVAAMVVAVAVRHVPESRDPTGPIPQQLLHCDLDAPASQAAALRRAKSP